MKGPKTFSEIKRDFKSDVKKIKDDYRRDTKDVPLGARIGAYIFLAVIGFIVFFVFFGPESPKIEDRFCQDNQSAASDAYAMAQVYVKRQLREPESAIMPPEPISSIWLGDCSFRVAGSVRARNGFGGYSESMYSVVVQYHAETETFRYSGLSFF